MPFMFSFWAYCLARKSESTREVIIWIIIGIDNIVWVVVIHLVEELIWVNPIIVWRLVILFADSPLGVLAAFGLASCAFGALVIVLIHVPVVARKVVHFFFCILYTGFAFTSAKGALHGYFVTGIIIELPRSSMIVVLSCIIRIDLRLWLSMVTVSGFGFFFGLRAF